MIIDCIADLHGYYPKLEGGDLLIVAGDLTTRDEPEQYVDFAEWLDVQPYRKKIVICGNHDNNFEPDLIQCLRCSYLEDSSEQFEGLKIWGSPWTKTFEGMNPRCKAFTCDTEEELSEKWSLIPDDIDILITHSPPHSILDKCSNGYQAGSKMLRRIMGRVKPKLWVCGHIHEAYGELKDRTLSGINYHIVNASYVNEHYHPVNKPVRVIL